MKDETFPEILWVPETSDLFAYMSLIPSQFVSIPDRSDPLPEVIAPAGVTSTVLTHDRCVRFREASMRRSAR